MKHFTYHIGGHELRLKIDGQRETVAELLVDGAPPQVPAEDMPAYAAAIALALLEHDVEVVHDEEPGVITLKPHRTPWGRPAGLQQPATPATSQNDSSLPQGEVC